MPPVFDLDFRITQIQSVLTFQIVNIKPGFIQLVNFLSIFCGLYLILNELKCLCSFDWHASQWKLPFVLQKKRANLNGEGSGNGIVTILARSAVDIRIHSAEKACQIVAEKAVGTAS